MFFHILILRYLKERNNKAEQLEIIKKRKIIALFEASYQVQRESHITSEQFVDLFSLIETVHSKSPSAHLLF